MLFAVKIKNIANISNKRSKINTSSNSARVLIKLFDFLYIMDEKLLIFE